MYSPNPFITICIGTTIDDQTGYVARIKMTFIDKAIPTPPTPSSSPLFLFV